MDAYKIVIHGYAVDELGDANPIIYTFHDFESAMSALKFFDMAGICTCTFIPIENLEE